MLVFAVHLWHATNSLLLFLQTGPVEGVIFADYGTDLGSGPTVPGMHSNFIISVASYALSLTGGHA